MTALNSEVRDGMRIDWDVPIEMADGIVLRADVFRPIDETNLPAILSYGPYAKWQHYQDGAPYQWNRMSQDHPDTVAGSSNRYQAWEVVDPEKWVVDGYACVRVDSRGAGRSPGYLDPWSPRETTDLYECIEWAAAQDWSNGKIGLNGISYYAMNQWQVAAMEPPHLAALCIWEGAGDFYREMGYHGGIRCTFTDVWYPNRVLPQQHGLGIRGDRSRVTGDWICGPETLGDEALGANRTDLSADIAAHPVIDDYWTERTPDFSKIRAPLLSAGNWGGTGLHERGNIEGFLEAGSDQKWLEVHGLQHWTHFYTDYGVALQKRFFGHFLKGEDTGWETQPRVQLQVRNVDGHFEKRHEKEWPLQRTEWTKFFLDPQSCGLSMSPATTEATITYDPFGDGVTFLTEPLDEPLEITGPLAAKLFVSSETEDADFFVVVRVFAPDLNEVTFPGANEPHTPVAMGWLRASHRKLDPERTLPYRPYHTHDDPEPLTPGNVYELDLEIWPTSITVPAGYRIGFSVRGRDYVYPGSPPQPLPTQGLGATAAAVFTGVGPFRHNDPHDRVPDVFGGAVTLHFDTTMQPYLLVPIIP